MTNNAPGKLFGSYPPYVYEPISPGQIRILTLHTGNLCSSIRCTLSPVLLRGESRRWISTWPPYDGKYQAPSYTWGTTNPTAPIICNGQIIEVTRNLHEALLYLRHRGTQTLWIDAICIDQSNLVERTAQVSIMKQIYEEATNVVVWLGAGSVETKKAFEFLDWIDHQVSSRWPFSQPSRDPQTWNACPDEELAAVSALIGRPWFRRVWIIQEVLAATGSVSSNIWLYCGKQARLWDNFMSAFEAMAQSQVLDILLKTNEIYTAINQLAFFTSVLAGEIELTSLVSEARRAEATDPRDKVYALLSLAKDRAKFERHVSGPDRFFPT